MSVVLDYLLQEYRGRFAVLDDVVSVSSLPSLVAPADYDRPLLTIVNLGTEKVYLSPTRFPSPSRGIALVPAGGSVSMNVRSDLLLPAWEWYAVTGTGTSTLYVLQVRRVSVEA